MGVGVGGVSASQRAWDWRSGISSEGGEVSWAQQRNILMRALNQSHQMCFGVEPVHVLEQFQPSLRRLLSSSEIWGLNPPPAGMTSGGNDFKIDSVDFSISLFV